MAAKKSSATKTGTKKKTTTKKAATKRGASAETAAKSGTPKGTKGKKAGAPKAAGAAKKAAPIKLNDRQSELLRKVHGAGESGYTIGQKTEQRTIDALQERKLLKRGAKNKATGQHSYTLTKAGEKHLGGGASGATGGSSMGGNA